jgi:hypothetical protein
MTPRLRIPAERTLVSARVSHILSPIEADLLQSGANYRKHVIDIAGSEYEGSTGRMAEDVRSLRRYRYRLCLGVESGHLACLYVRGSGPKAPVAQDPGGA